MDSVKLEEKVALFGHVLGQIDEHLFRTFAG